MTVLHPNLCCIIKGMHCIWFIQAWICQIQGPLKDFPELFKDYQLKKNSDLKAIDNLIKLHILTLPLLNFRDSKICVKCPLSKRPKHSAIHSTFIKLPGVSKIFVLSMSKWPFYTVFTVQTLCRFAQRCYCDANCELQQMYT